MNPLMFLVSYVLLFLSLFLLCFNCESNYDVKNGESRLMSEMTSDHGRIRRLANNDRVIKVFALLLLAKL